jgi:hypothetical protein
VGVGTVVYALAIGPLVQLLLPRFTVPETRKVAAGKGGDQAGGPGVGEPSEAAVSAA